MDEPHSGSLIKSASFTVFARIAIGVRTSTGENFDLLERLHVLDDVVDRVKVREVLRSKLKPARGRALDRGRSHSPEKLDEIENRGEKRRSH